MVIDDEHANAVQGPGDGHVPGLPRTRAPVAHWPVGGGDRRDSVCGEAGVSEERGVMARASNAPRILAITVERVGDRIRARAWAESGIARFWRAVEEDTLASEDALTRWVSSLDTRHGGAASVLVGTEMKSDEPLMEAIRRGIEAASTGRPR